MLVVVWRRFDGPARITLPLSGIKPGASAEILFPGSSDAEVGWDESAGALTVTLPRSPQACLVRVLGSEPIPADTEQKRKQHTHE